MLSLDKIFSDGMIMQQDTENKVSGTASPRSSVTLSLTRSGREIFSASAEAGGENGRWDITLPSMKGGFEPYELLVKCGEESITVRDVYAGELFHISGQSNMELPLSRTVDPLRDDNNYSDYHYIREFRTQISIKFPKSGKADDFAGGWWKIAEGNDKFDMSAAGYYFAEEIFRRLNVPVGMVNTSAGGAALESFMPYEMIKEYKIHDDFLEKATEEGYIENLVNDCLKKEAEWYAALGNEDFGLRPSADMKSCTVPVCTNELEGSNGFSGRIFFFREFTIPDDFPLDGAQFILGTMADSDTVFVNGTKIGETGYLYPPRYYTPAAGVLKKGVNTIAVRLEIKGGCGGFTKGKRYCLKSGCREIELSGEWKYAAAAKAEPFTLSAFMQDKPLALWSDMMAPAMRYKYRAFLWYQGETNAGRAYIYKRMFTDFVNFYRRECGYEIPFIFTQLCNYEGTFGHSGSESWAEFREAQLQCLDISGTAMAVTADAGEYNDLHPKDKKTVGKRLAYCAGGLLYGDDTVFVRCEGAESSDSENGTDITLRFDGDVFLKNGKAEAFEAVFSDGAYKCGDTPAETCGKTLKLNCSHKGQLLEVRYAWKNNPHTLDLLDLTMKPVSPFRVKL